MSQGFKNLLPRTFSSDQTIYILTRKTDEYRKVTQQSTDLAIQIWKSFGSQSTDSKKIIDCTKLQIKDAKDQQYFGNIFQAYQDNYQLTQQFSNNIEQYLSELTSSNTSSVTNFSASLTVFQQQFKGYQNAETTALQLNRKHHKQLKSLNYNIDAYKNSFNQAKLIYNRQEKIKRYSNCEQNYKTAKEQNSLLLEMGKKLDNKKKQIIQTFSEFEEQIQQNQIIANIKIFKFLSYFLRGFYNSIKQKKEIIGKHKKQLQNSKFTTLLNLKIVIKSGQAQQMQNQNQYHTLAQSLNLLHEFKIDNHHLKLASFLKNFEEALQKDRKKHKALIALHSEYYKLVQKTFLPHLKQVILYCQRVSKKSKNTFSEIPCQTLQKIIKVLTSTSSICEIYVRKIIKKFTVITNQLLPEKKQTIRIMQQEIKTHTQKIFATVNGYSDDENKTQDNISHHELKTKYQFLEHLIIGFDEKINLVNQKIRRVYNDIMTDFYVELAELQSLCSQNKQSEIEEGNQILFIKRVEIQRFKGTIFQDLKKQEMKKAIVYDSEEDKLNEFIKLRKPPGIQSDSQGNKLEHPTRDTVRYTNNSELSPEIKQETLPNIMSQENKKQQIEEGQTLKQKKTRYQKNRDFLHTKISFHEDQQLLHVFSCAMADKIILQGKLFVTNDRLCFFSKFNAGNIFFGGTFIQIPKKDIITFQKRKNGIFFDNSISLTTINGELFFTSFFKRNLAFETIAKITGKNVEDIAYQSQSDSDEHSQKISESIDQKMQHEEIVDDDDLRQEQIPERITKLQQLLFKHPYKQLISLDVQYQNLNAFKILKYFILDDQVTIAKKKYPSFQNYYKKAILHHVDIDLTGYDPPLIPYLNKNNIKNTTPAFFTRHSKSTFPIISTGIPFLPKSAKTQQVYKLYIHSKNKWIAESEIKNEGAPYTDCFNVYLKTVCESNNEGQCKIITYIYLHFLKSTMMKGILESKTFQQTKIQINKLFEQYKKYLKNVHAIQIKPKKVIMTGKDNNPTAQQQLLLLENQKLAQKIEQYSTQIEQLSKQKQQLIIQNKSNTQKYKSMLIGAIVIYLLTVILLLFIK